MNSAQPSPPPALNGFVPDAGSPAANTSLMEASAKSSASADPTHSAVILAVAT